VFAVGEVRCGNIKRVSWKSTATVVHDLHGEKDSARGEAVSFEKKERRQGSGAFTAPFAGIHGWYWENPGGETITLTVRSAGFYTEALEFRSDRTRRAHELTALAYDKQQSEKPQ
jgi:hypothetical protein